MGLGGVHLKHGGVNFDNCVVQSIDVPVQRAWDLELLDDHLEDKATDLRLLD